MRDHKTNLLQETIEELAKNNKTPADVLWCGCEQYFFTWDDFVNLANFKYSKGYGGVEAPMDLIVVGNDFWLERHEYDGSEWWEFKQMPIKPLINYVPTSLGLGWDCKNLIDQAQKFVDMVES